MAAATAVSGLQRNILPSLVPLLPSKFRLKVRSETPPDGGDWPLPMQGPQVDSRMRAPASIRYESPLLRAIMSRTCFDPGEMVMLTSGWTLKPPFLNVSATSIRSLKDEFVQLPTQTWSTFMPSISETLQTWSGMWGLAIIGSNLPRSSSIVSSYLW